jgi:uncharacterized protein (TIGR03437 family)
MSRFFPIAAVLCLAAPSFARQEFTTCGTHREKWREELFLHRRSERARLLKRSLQAAQGRMLAPAVARDYGEIAVMDDADGVVARRNDFNLNAQTVVFTPAAPGAASYRFRVRENSYDAEAAKAGAALALKDDDFQSVGFAFDFPFYGSVYRSVMVNSDGNLTLGAGDAAISERSLGRLIAGPPRIAALFHDLDPSKSTSGVRVLAAPDRLVVSWVNVPEYLDTGLGPLQTFQIRLYPDGRVELAFEDITTDSAVTGITPGGMRTAASVVSFSSNQSGEYSSTLAEVFQSKIAVDMVRVAQRFYETHEDSYDYLVAFNALGVAAGDSAVAFESTVRNHRGGYGDIEIETGAEYGSAYRLQAIMNMGPLSQYPVDPSAYVPVRAASRDTPVTILAHEAGHLFLAYASVRNESDSTARPMLGYQNAHWIFTFNSEASLLEGNRIRDDGPSASPRFVTTGTVEGFSPLDQYLMGFRPAAEVSPTFLITGASSVYRYRTPQAGVGINGGRRDVAIEELISDEGRRTPDHTVAQRHFRFGFILIVAAGSEPSADDLARVERYRAEFEKYYRRASSERAWAEATLRRSLRLSLFPAAGVLEGGTATASIMLGSPTAAPVTVLLRTASGAASMPASVTIPAGAQRADFTVTGVHAGVEELTAEPADSSYETAHARLQVSNGGSGIRIYPSSGERPDANGNVTVRVTDINELPYPAVTVRATASGSGSPVTVAAATNERGEAVIAWPSGTDNGARLEVRGDGVTGGFVLGGSGTPATSSAWVVNSASLAPGVVPGSFATIYGTNLAGGYTVVPPLPWPVEMQGVRVAIAGRLAQLHYLSDGQINCLIPSGIPEGTAELSVTTPRGTSQAVQVSVRAVSPGIFAVVRSGSTRSTLESPARRGDYLEIYSTGLGPLSTAALPETTYRPEVSLGGVSAPVVYSGLTPGIPGLYQVNVQVPQQAPSGRSPLSITVNSQPSNAVEVGIE